MFQSELVVKEFDSIMGELRQLSMMASRFPDFDLQGKEMFLDKVRTVWQRPGEGAKGGRGLARTLAVVVVVTVVVKVADEVLVVVDLHGKELFLHKVIAATRKGGSWQQSQLQFRVLLVVLFRSSGGI